MKCLLMIFNGLKNNKTQPRFKLRKKRKIEKEQKKKQKMKEVKKILLNMKIEYHK